MEQLGIQPIQLITQVVNFTLMVVLLTKFLYKPILKALNDRKKKIVEGLEYAEKMKLEAEKNEKKREEIIDRAKEEARKIIEESKKTAKQVEADILKDAQEEAGLILAKEREALAQERQELERQLRVKTIEIAQGWVTAVLGKVLGTKVQTAIINKKIAELARLKE